MKRWMTAVSLVLACGSVRAAWACDCQKREAQKQCNCAAQSCPGECAGHGEAPKARPKPDKSKRTSS
jgi:hypothetical protein